MPSSTIFNQRVVNILIKEEEITTLSGLPALKVLGHWITQKRKKKEGTLSISLMYLILNKGDQPYFALRKGGRIENPLKKGYGQF